MRHLKAGKALGVKPAHRRAMLRNLVTSVLEKQRIRTTVTRAKELRRPLDKMITLGKRGDLNARRQALTFVKSKEAMANLFGELAERYKDREGGYTRILRLGPRRGDGAEMALVMLVGSPDDPFAEAPKPRRKGGGRRRGKQTLEQVAEEVKDEGKTSRRGRGQRSTKAAAAAGQAEAAEATDEEAQGKAKAEEPTAEDAASEETTSAETVPAGESEDKQ